MTHTDHHHERPVLIAVTGPTASGKTRFAALLAHRLNGEIISADSRQVYRGMDLGTGKDYADYLVDGRPVPAHLLDITDPGSPYNVYAYQQDFIRTFRDITGRGRTPVLCGGSGLYLEAVLKGYRLTEVPPDAAFRSQAAQRSNEDLTDELASLQPLHNSTDTVNRKRLIRALEIARFYRDHPAPDRDFPAFMTCIIGIRYDRQTERERITRRLTERLDQGMIQEVETLGLQYGWDRMEYFGLEYKFVSLYLKKEITRDDMFARLNTAIHQFAKRQMTWFRRMERQGTHIFWIDGAWSEEKKMQEALSYLRQCSEEA